MAYTTATLKPRNVGASGSETQMIADWWVYYTTDALATVRAANYFSDAATKKLQPGNQIAVHATDGYDVLCIVSSTTAGATTASQGLIVDVTEETPTDGVFIVGNGTAWVGESGATARASMGVTIGTHVQAWDADLDAIAALAKTDGNFIVGDGSTWVAESGSTARASIGISAAMDSVVTAASLEVARAALLIEPDFTTTAGAVSILAAMRGTVQMLNATASARTATLPDAATVGNGWEITIGKSDVSANAVTIACAGSDTIGAGGPAFAVTSVTDNGSGKARVTLGENRTVIAAEKVVLAGTSVSAYNTTHTVLTRVNDSGTAIDLDFNYTSDATGGTFIRLDVQIVLQTPKTVTLISDGTKWQIKGDPGMYLPHQDFLLGRNVGYSGPNVGGSQYNLNLNVGFIWNSGLNRAETRSLILKEISDPPEAYFMRIEYGSGVYPFTTSYAAVPSDATLGLNRYMGSTSDGTMQGTSVTTYAKAAENITGSASGGYYEIAPTPTGSTSGTPSFRAAANGDIHLGGVGGAQGLLVTKVASSVNYPNVFGATGGAANYGVAGTSSGISWQASSKGADVLDFFTNDFSIRAMRIAPVASADRYLIMSPSNGADPLVGTSAGNVRIDTPLQLKAYTIATKPASGVSAGAIAYVSDGDGDKDLMIYDSGGAWRYPNGGLV